MSAPAAAAASTGAAAAGGAGAAPSVVDPDAIWYYMGLDGLQRGPTTPLIIADLLLERSINSQTFGWRAGLPDWAPLSSMPELKGIFATAFDAPDDVSAATAQKKGGKGGAAAAARPGQGAAASDSSAAAAGGAAASSSSSSSSATPAAPADPLAVWYYLDKYRAQQGPVRAEEIVRLYKLLQLNDASLVWSGGGGAAVEAAGAPSAGASAASNGTGVSAAAVSGSGGWVRLAECASFDGLIGPEVLEAGKAERDAFLAEEVRKEAQKKRKRDRAALSNATAGATKWRKAPANHSNVYVTGLPRDVTPQELVGVMKKGGIILTDPESGAPAVKIYRDESTGEPKGDALVKYALPASVELARELLDGYVFRPAVWRAGGAKVAPDYVIQVSKAEFVMKGAQFDASKVDSKVAERAAAKKAKLAAGGGGAQGADAARLQLGAMTAAEIAKQRLAESLSWAEDDDFESSGPGSSKLRIVILRPMFTLEDAAAHPDGEDAFYAELKNEIGAEVEEKVSKAVAAAAGHNAAAGPTNSKGCIEKLTVFAGNASGPVAVKFRTSTHAAACISLMNGRMFAGAKLAAFYFDGKTNYVVKQAKATEGEEETDKRLDEFGDWIERQGAEHDDE